MNVTERPPTEVMLPVCKVVFMEVHEPRGHVTRHSLEDQRVWRVRVGDSTAVQVAFQVALRGRQERLMNIRKKENNYTSLFCC